MDKENIIDIPSVSKRKITLIVNMNKHLVNIDI